VVSLGGTLSYMKVSSDLFVRLRCLRGDFVLIILIIAPPALKEQFNILTENRMRRSVPLSCLYGKYKTTELNK